MIFFGEEDMDIFSCFYNPQNLLNCNKQTETFLGCKSNYGSGKPFIFRAFSMTVPFQSNKGGCCFHFLTFSAADGRHLI